MTKLDQPIIAVLLLTVLVLAMAHVMHWAANKAGGTNPNSAMGGVARFFTLQQGGQ